MHPSTAIVLSDGTQFKILYEDRSVLAIDKPSGWMLAPESWVKTRRNLQLALESSIHSGEFWARSRRIRFLRYVHRLDAETSGVLLLAKSLGAIPAYSQLFSRGQVRKSYLAVVGSKPRQNQWSCTLSLADDPKRPQRMIAVRRNGQPAETEFRVVCSLPEATLIEATPLTGRTHQIRVHLAESGCPIVGDPIYGKNAPGGERLLGLRAVALSYQDPFRRSNVRILAPADEFLRNFGFAPDTWVSPMAWLNLLPGKNPLA